jgi:hypothetical protein
LRLRVGVQDSITVLWEAVKEFLVCQELIVMLSRRLSLLNVCKQLEDPSVIQ